MLLFHNVQLTDTSSISHVFFNVYYVVGVVGVDFKYRTMSYMLEAVREQNVLIVGSQINYTHSL